MPTDLSRLKAAIHYLSLCADGDENFGATKLNKQLWFADVEAFRRFGRSVTHDEYQRLPFGPAPRRLLPAMRELEQENRVMFVERELWGRLQKRPIALKDPDLTALNQNDVAILSHVVQLFRTWNAAELSEASHDGLGWRLASPGETIPLHSSLVSERPLTSAEFSGADGLQS